jgi:IclR family transcriptional regulator, acetate operon repressor
MPTETGTQAIDRAAQLLVRVVESAEPLGIGELAAHSGLPKSTTSRLVSALERQGLVQRFGDTRTLRPGPVLLRFAHRDGNRSLVELAGPVLDLLAAETRETINLAVPSPLGVEHVAQRDSVHFVGVTNWVGRRIPHHVAANGKVFLAYGSVPVPERLEAFTPHTIISREALAHELGRIRAAGYASAINELELGLAAVAAPVRAGGAVIAALSISGPDARLTAERGEQLAPFLIEQCDALGRLLEGSDQQKRGVA